MEKNINDLSKPDRNAMYLTIRMTIAIVVGLFTSRIALAALGVDDYGLLGVICATVGIFSFVNSALTESSTRFISCADHSDSKKLRLTFSKVLTLHSLVAVSLMVFAMTIGLWFVRSSLNIPADSIETASVVFVLTALPAAVSVFRSAYAAAVTSRERMSFYAAIEIVNVILRLAAALYIASVPQARLMIYAALSLATDLIITVCYIAFCTYNFDECRRPWPILSGLREMSEFSGWELTSRLSNALSTHATDIIINIFCGLGYSAAIAVCRKVSQAAVGLAGAPAMAFKPVIFKQFSGGDTQRMTETMSDACRLCIPVACMIAMPCLLTGDRLLALWLGEVPAHTAGLLNIIIIGVMFEPMLRISACGVMATGHIRRVSLINSMITATAFLLSFLILRNGGEPTTACIIQIPALVACITANLTVTRAIVKDFDIRQVIMSAIISYLVCVPGAFIAMGVTTLCVNLSDAVTVAAVSGSYLTVTALLHRLSRPGKRPVYILRRR